MSRPLSALLSQVLVAFTVEFDNEFERRTGTRLSLVVWSELMRFMAGGEMTVGDLALKASAQLNPLKLGCLERWGFVVLGPDPGRRNGWGSGRGIRADWIVRLTSRGVKAIEVWPPLFDVIERRWEKRFGRDEINGLRQSLRRISGAPERDPLPMLLSQALQAFETEFQQELRTPLALCASTLRVLGVDPIPEAEIPRLTGSSPETSGIGWQHKPFVVVEQDQARGRGKVVRLSPLGIKVQHKSNRVIGEIEMRWELKFGKDEIDRLRELLLGLFENISEGLQPPPGVVRAGAEAPALGRRDLGVAAKKRNRDMVVQTEAFVRDPAGSLPHYPLWDMNRGFGP